LKRIIQGNIQINVKKKYTEKILQRKKIQQVLASLYTPMKQATHNFLSSQHSLEITHIPNNNLSDASASCDFKSSLEILKDHLRCWTIGHHIAQTAISDLLKIIKSDLKLIARTLFKTENISNKILNLSLGKYYHFELKSKLLLKLIQNDFKGNEVNISVNIDGLPLTKSSGRQFWPILIKIDKLEKLKPFPMGIYHGETFFSVLRGEKIFQRHPRLVQWVRLVLTLNLG
jgi:hypothetical protein